MPVSRAQVRLAHDVIEGKSDRMPVHVAQEIVDQMHGRSMSELPERVRPKQEKKSSIRVGGRSGRKPTDDPRDITVAVRKRR